MIQFNLLPDVKKEYIKAKRTKALILNVSAISIVISVVAVLIMFSFVQGVQKKHITDLTKDIKSGIASITDIQDLDKILTIQHQLGELTTLHEEKPETSRIFGYLNQLTPISVKISSITLNIDDSTLIISGTSDSLASINQYIDTLKFSSFDTTDTENNQPFNDIVSQMSRNESKSSYEVSMTFDPILFNNTESVILNVPDKITTRSVIGKPTLNNVQATPDNPLFNDPGNSGGGQ